VTPSNITRFPASRQSDVNDPFNGPEPGAQWGDHPRTPDPRFSALWSNLMALIAIVHIPDHTADDAQVLFKRNGEMTSNFAASGRIVGLYEFPHLRKLKCNGYCTHKNSGAWHRDGLGFIKCRICGSRNKNIRKWFAGALFDWFGANLIGDDAPALFRTPEGYGPRDELTPSK
jgi:hypothetical protein